MNLKEVSTEKFDALMKKNIDLKRCPKCAIYGGRIIIDMPEYGKSGVYCKCYQCGIETKRRQANITITDGQKRLGTPIIEKSLMSAIREAINDWNRKDEKQ